MAPPLLAVRQFTFRHELPCTEDQVGTGNCETNKNLEATTAIPIARVTVQVLSFNRRCFWVHLSESRESSDAPPPPFGPCAVAFDGVAADATSSILIDDAPLAVHDEEGESGAGAPNPHAALAESLSQRLAHRLKKECASPGVAVYVACGFAGEKVELWGTPAGSSFDVTMRFGAALFSFVLELIREEVLSKSKA
ncbi:hypothetical protein C3747_32g277 [Trypanosoma cruzi]|uniref:Proteasome assembly chaperone 3 n=2 Tax=Trypanosoma cruzi TaxID=5693 RepID=Q4DJQ8_TRYCC|nr:hypothetical protein, conserved [Trypanosoma cruzi]EAN92765.1 hypothetical protein, conserved [Trypanosoma cruzi]PWV15065.1 hypothetical protein C3747_32g277 [Trypanosoma cruzi]RNC43177.1 hypothetical protein TcCL_NonESM07155 [Trypanosoma cruzi]|eukprot:XP_814616.1 hypothetical protein [Trypanosoma cruzi strain CL Brener]